MEPITKAKQEQLDVASKKRKRTSIPHRRYCHQEKWQISKKEQDVQQYSDANIGESFQSTSFQSSTGEFNNTNEFQSFLNESMNDDESYLAECTEGQNFEDVRDDAVLMGFNDMITFENKTICIIGRQPYWTAFRHFLIHLHLLSGSASDIPLERYISVSKAGLYFRLVLIR